jgi:predicted metal-binding protein
VKDHVRSNWSAAILVCGKCSKKLDGGFGDGGKLSLAKALRRASSGKGRKAALGVSEVTCLDICPRNAVVVIDTARPQRWEIVRRGEPVDDVLARLGRCADGSETI